MSRPTRTSRPPLTPAQALVPLSLRPAPLTLVTTQENMEQTFTAAPAPFPMSLPPVALRNPPAHGRRRPAPFPVQRTEPLESLASENNAHFQEVLSALKKETHAIYNPRERTPPPVLLTDAIDLELEEARALAPTTETAPISTTPFIARSMAPIPTRLYRSLVFVNVKNQNFQDSAEAFVLIALLPGNPFASQIITTLWPMPRLEAMVRKWHQSRIFFAFSRKLISVKDKSYNDENSGYQDLGPYCDVVGDFDAYGIGGASDIVVPTVLETERTREMRTLYGLPAITNVFCIYIFNIDATSHAADIVAAAAAASHEQTVPFLAAQPEASSSSSMLRSNTQVQRYLEERFPECVALYRALAQSTLGPAYRRYSGIRLIRHIATEIGMIWPDVGLPKPVTLTEPDGMIISITDIQNLLPTSVSVSLGTLGNHVADYNACVRALRLLIEKSNMPQGVLTTNESNAGSLLFTLLEAPFLELTMPGFVVPVAYNTAVIVSAASVKVKANAILKGEDPGA
ncbi:hypothetical protein B0H11DRAFT_2347224 [Mycena galericulata]|nr:hypothetical protein B0H11DRAFT_2347224 [Mycena galericulata]